MPFRVSKPKRFAKKKWTPSRFKKKAFRSATKYSRKSTYKKNRYVAKSLKTMAETKKILGRPQTDLVPVTTFGVGPASSDVYQLTFDFSNAALSNPFGTALDCSTIAQGVAANQRTGNYVYLKSYQGALRISMTTPVDSPTPELNQPIRFKVIFFKNKRIYSPVGSVSQPTQSLFLTPDGNSIGPNTGTLTQQMTKLQFYAAPFNLRHYKIGMVKQFTLGPPLNLGDNAHHLNNAQSMSNLKSQKIIKFNLPVWQKCKYDTSNHVEDRDVHWRCFVLAIPSGGGTTGPANQWRMSMDSVGLYNDV